MFFDPPRAINNPNSTLFSVKSIIETFRLVEVLNKSPSWLFVCTCSLLQLGSLQTSLAEVLPYTKTLKIGTLTCVSQLESKQWYNPTIGLIFLWKGNYSDCTNNARCGSYQNTSLSFLCQQDSSCLYCGTGNEIVDDTELPLLFCQQLLLLHTVPGDTVLDLCAGSGAFTCQALCGGRNVIAIEDNEARYHAICNLVRATAVGIISEAIMEGEIDNDDKTRQLASDISSGGDSGEIEESENHFGTCAECLGIMTLKSQQTRCQTCNRVLHKSCSKTVQAGADIFRQCPQSLWGCILQFDHFSFRFSFFLCFCATFFGG